MRILIAVPTFENIYPDTFKSIYGLDGGEHELMFDFARGYDCATARNNIARKALENDADYVLMIDNDVIVPSDAIINFLDNPKDVCLGYYAHRNNANVYEGRSCICMLTSMDGEKTYFNYPLESEYTAQDIELLKSRGETKIAIHGGGMGCAFIKTEVFKRIDYPWFDWVNYNDKNRGMLSEDLYFCENCRNHGIEIWSDIRVGCGHMMRHVQWVV